MFKNSMNPRNSSCLVDSIAQKHLFTILKSIYLSSSYDIRNLYLQPMYHRQIQNPPPRLTSTAIQRKKKKLSRHIDKGGTIRNEKSSSFGFFLLLLQLLLVPGPLISPILLSKDVRGKYSRMVVYGMDMYLLYKQRVEWRVGLIREELSPCLFVVWFWGILS